MRTIALALAGLHIITLPAYAEITTFESTAVVNNGRADTNAKIRTSSTSTWLGKIAPVLKPANFALVFAGLAIIAGGAASKRNRIVPHETSPQPGQESKEQNDQPT